MVGTWRDDGRRGLVDFTLATGDNQGFGQYATKANTPTGDRQTRERPWIRGAVVHLAGYARAAVRSVPGVSDTASVYRRLLKLTLEEVRVIEDHLGQLDHQ